MTLTSHPLWASFENVTQTARPDGGAHIVALTSAFSQSGTSFVARDLALLAAQHYMPQGGRAALIDFDVNQQTQAAGFDTPKSIAKHGALQGPYDASFGQTPFWQVSPEMVSGDGKRGKSASHCGLFFVGETGLAVSRFEWETVKDGQTVHVTKAPDYWQAARSQFSVIIVDCPAFERTDIALNVICEADATILISPKHRSTDLELVSLAQTISASGGTCAGMILNDGLPMQKYAGTAI